MKYLTKPKEVDAFSVIEILVAHSGNWYGLPDWVVDAYDRGNLVFAEHEGLTIYTPEGWQHAGRWDWLVCTPGGFVWPVSQADFRDNYTEAVPA